MFAVPRRESWPESRFLNHFAGKNGIGWKIHLKTYFDVLPDTKEKCTAFKEFILRLQNTESFREANIMIRMDDIAEVVSHDHVMLQCMDIILGSMFFRLNDLHLEKPEGSW